ncbi:MAG: glyceraldehyde 3-phosphate dehydrogenase [Phenylobacterium sp.]|jgi:glyceraldehyde 3-phosphate dehydrogenase
MTIRVAINGYGRIGRNILRALYEGNYRSDVKIVAINDLAETKLINHLTKFDSVHGRFNAEVGLTDNNLTVNGDVIELHQQRNPADLPWKALDIDVVLECTGFFTERSKAQAHIDAGAKKVIVSAPGKEMDATVVFGVNDHILTADHNIISNASCTTNCLSPVAKVLNDLVGIEAGSMTTIHAVTNDQSITDVAHSDLYRARCASLSMIPTQTGAAKAVGLVLPELAGKLDGMAVRVPTINVSVVDLTFYAKRETTVEEINQAMKAAAAKIPKVLEYNELPLVSIDFNHNPASSSFDAAQTRVNGRLVKVMAWYDNEWGFANRMLDNTLALMACANGAQQATEAAA